MNWKCFFPFLFAHKTIRLQHSGCPEQTSSSQRAVTEFISSKKNVHKHILNVVFYICFILFNKYMFSHLYMELFHSRIMCHFIKISSINVYKHAAKQTQISAVFKMFQCFMCLCAV